MIIQINYSKKKSEICLSTIRTCVTPFKVYIEKCGSIGQYWQSNTKHHTVKKIDYSNCMNSTKYQKEKFLYGNGIIVFLFTYFFLYCQQIKIHNLISIRLMQIIK